MRMRCSTEEVNRQDHREEQSGTARTPSRIIHDAEDGRRDMIGQVT